MQILRFLAARRAASTIIASPVSELRNDDGAFFDLDFSSSSSSSLSFSDSDDECTVHDFIISLQRSSSASPLICGGAAAPLETFCASDTPAELNASCKRGISGLRTLSFGVRKAVPLYGRSGFARSSSGRCSSSTAQFVDLPSRRTEEEHATQTSRRAPSRDVLRRCLAKISRRIRTAASPRAAKARGIHRLRKCRSGSSAAPPPGWVPASHDGESAVEKQEGIAGAIAHCKESLHRASTSECDSRLLRSRSE